MILHTLVSQHFFYPMVHQQNPFAHYFSVKGLWRIACLVGVHCYAGGEQDCWYPVVNKDPLVGKAVEHIGEVFAAVVCQADVQVDCEHSVACLEKFTLDRLERMRAEHYHEVFAVRPQR